MPAEPFLEDEALCRALRRHDLPVRHSERVSVVTSSRRRGRVAVGLSWQLREWQACLADGRDPAVADPRVWADALAWRRLLRSAWRAAADRSAPQDGPLLDALAGRLGRSRAAMAREWRRADAFGAFWQAVEPALLDSARPTRGPLPMRAGDRPAARAHRALTRGADLLEQVEPVALVARARDVTDQRARLAAVRPHGVVDVVAAEGIVGHFGRPVHEQPLAADRERAFDERRAFREVGARPVVGHLAGGDEIEDAGRKGTRAPPCARSAPGAAPRSGDVPARARRR